MSMSRLATSGRSLSRTELSSAGAGDPHLCPRCGDVGGRDAKVAIVLQRLRDQRLQAHVAQDVAMVEFGKGGRFGPVWIADRPTYRHWHCGRAGSGIKRGAAGEQQRC